MDRGFHRVVAAAALTGPPSGGQRHRQQVGLGGEDVVVHVDGQLALLREQQVEVLEHLGQEKGVHPVPGVGGQEEEQNIIGHLLQRCVVKCAEWQFFPDVVQTTKKQSAVFTVKKIAQIVLDTILTNRMAAEVMLHLMSLSSTKTTTKHLWFQQASNT